ncbi:stage III sporulation protein AE, partial [Brevibacillus laterosporus]|nr:stage III sporulation protein AE [Brevibacillus laterosporus]
MAQRCTLLLLFLLLFFADGAIAAASTPEKFSPVEKMVKQQAEYLNLQQIETFWKKTLDQYEGYLPDLKQKGFMQLLMEDGGLSPSGMFKGILKFFFHEILMNGK